MKKKILSLMVSLSMILLLVACGNNATSSVSSDTSGSSETFELALVTDLGTIDDKSFNQGAWEGLKKYAEENGISYKYYQPQEASTNSYVETIELAIEGGAKLVVCPGFLFEEPVYLVQDSHPDVRFILLDGTPHNAEYTDFKTGSNVMPILYQEDQAGFLAGYAAVKDGNTKLGFLGGMAVPAVVRFGFGYVQGAEAAAEELGISDLEIMYNYTGGFNATPEAQSMAASWYNNGTEVIFGCGGSVGNSVMSAADAKNKQDGAFVAKVIGVDVDQYSESESVITSAVKMLANSVYSGVTDFYRGNFKGGNVTTFDIRNDGVGIAMEHAKFNTFSMADYNQVYSELMNGQWTIFNDTEETNPALALASKLTNVKVNYID